jgi:YbgC/YbaW family acyl-CoA thioester hydrolase
MADQTVTRDQFKFWKSIEVRWGDMDSVGHVNNTVYFTYLESARVELLRKLGVRGKQGGGAEGPALVSTSCDFKKQVIYPAVIDVGVCVETIGRRSFRTSYGLFLRGTDDLVATASGVNAWIDYAAERAVELPDWLRQALSEYQKTGGAERKRAEAALPETYAELAHVARVTTMGELAASIAHEVNQPLTAVITNADICLDWVMSERPNLNDIREALADVVKDAHRVSEIIARIRALLRKSAPAKVPLSLNEAIGEACALVRSELALKRIELHASLDSGLPLVVGDRVQLQQVMLNLIRNGVEAMAGIKDGPRELTITSRREGEDEALVEVRDTGVGLTPQELDQVFKPFFTTKADGMGMGMAISQTIINDHHGRIWAEPNAGRGLSFRFILPACKQEIESESGKEQGN